jgi:hypothetical protein
MILIISFSLLLIGGRKTNKTGFIGLIQIILVGYQEYEAREKFAFGDLLDKNNQTPELKEN